jgi:sigma-B regulation protein RsbU (phosphoserine phosphatase)
MSAETTLTQHKVKVLLIDDQPMIGELVRRMVAGEDDIVFRYCRDATKAIEEAKRFGPTVILQDLVMPEVDGLHLVRQFRAETATQETPLIVLSVKEEPQTKAEAFAHGANDYLVKLPDRLEVLARIRYHSKGYINLLQRNEAFAALLESQRTLAKDVAEAAKYVRSLLPEPLAKGPVQADWRFIPSATLGGDSFCYHELDDDHYAFYLLDVSGHGVGAALLSVSVLNALKSRSLPETDFRNPGAVLTALNRVFQMEQQNDLYFTIWYGVYNRPARRIDYSGGGHPPAILLTGPSAEQTTLRLLDSKSPMVGAIPEVEYHTLSCPVDAFSKVFLYSDGVYEIARPDGTMWHHEDFVASLTADPPSGESPLDRLIQHARAIGGKNEFKDDFSVVEIRFLPTS